MEIVKNEDLGKKPTREPFLSQGPVPKLNPRGHGVWIVSTRFSWDFSRTTAGSGQECLELWVHSPRFLERQRGDVPALSPCRLGPVRCGSTRRGQGYRPLAEKPIVMPGRGEELAVKCTDCLLHLISP
jgi:hypothetical protein